MFLTWLFRYDKDKDHSPGLFEGATAHWALVTGLICLESSSNEIEVGGSFSPCDCASASEKDVDRCEVWPLSGYPIGAWVGVSSGALTVGVKSQILRDHFAVPYFAAFQVCCRNFKPWVKLLFTLLLQRAFSSSPVFSVVPNSTIKSQNR